MVVVWIIGVIVCVNGDWMMFIIGISGLVINRVGWLLN